MTDKEDFIIQEPYQPTEEERQAIKELEDKEQGLVAEDWDSQKTYIKSFKKNLRNDMYKKQNKLCAFCRIHVPSAVSCLSLVNVGLFSSCMLFGHFTATKGGVRSTPWASSTSVPP